MRAWLLTVAVVLLPALGLSANYSVRNPAIRNPVGVGTSPVSSLRSSLIRTLSPIDATGNLVITGNVRGGKSFQAPVQYNSTTEFESNLGTSTLSSFLRDATGSEDLGRYRRRYGIRPYYSPAETVATTIPGRPGVFGPASTRNRALAPQQRRPVETHLFALEPLPKQQILPGRGTTTTDADLQGLRAQYGLLAESLTTSDDVSARDISLGLRDVERLTPGDAAMRRQDEPLTSERLAEQRRQSLLKVQQARIDDGLTLADDTKLEAEAVAPARSAADIKNRIASSYRLSPLQMPAPSVAPALQPEAVRPVEPELRPTPRPLTPGELDGFMKRRVEGAEAAPGAMVFPSGIGPEEAPGAEQSDMLKRIRQQLDDLAKSVDSRLQVGDQGGGDISAEESKRMSPVTERYTSGSAEILRSSELQRGGLGLGGKEMLAPAKMSGAFGRADYRGQTGLGFRERPTLEVSGKITSLPGGLSKLSRSDMSSEAKRIRGTHQSLDSLSQDKFIGHMLVAENYLRTGKYYKAANFFALASIYKPDDPQALVGRSHALFAAGEYISSALFLSRALAINPEYAKAKIDFVTLLGGQGRLAGRIGDVEQWFARSGSGRLQLLLGYVYYQTGKLNEAAKAIKAAQAKMPQSPAIPAIRAAIDAAVAK